MIRAMGCSSQRHLTLGLGLLALSIGLAAVGVVIARGGDHPPQPLRVYNPIRVTIAGGCPASIKGHDGISNPEPDHLDQRLAPLKPAHGLICRYTPLGGLQRAGIKYGVLYESASLTQSDARHLADDLDRIPPGKKGAFVSCPADIAQYDILILGYGGLQDVDLRISQTGCGVIDNGYAGRISRSPQADKFGKDFADVAGPAYRQPER
jgi:hypothetical protein